MNSDFSKNRNFSECMSEALSLMTGNFRSLLRGTWKSLVAMALSLTFTFVLISELQTVVSFATESPVVYCIFLCLAVILSLISLSWMLAAIASLFTKVTIKSLFKDSAYVVGIYVIGIAIIITLSAILCYALNGRLYVVDSTFIYDNWPWILGLLLISMLVMQPLTLVSSVRLFHLSEQANSVKSLLKMALRYRSYLFIGKFSSVLIFFVIASIVFLPMAILMLASINSWRGVIEGDPSGMPSGFIYYFIICSILTFFVVSFMGIWLVISNMLFSSSILAKEEERKSFVSQDVNVLEK